MIIIDMGPTHNLTSSPRCVCTESYQALIDGAWARVTWRPFAINHFAVPLPAFFLVALLLFELSFCLGARQALWVIVLLVHYKASSQVAFLFFEVSFCWKANWALRVIMAIMHLAFGRLGIWRTQARKHSDILALGHSDFFKHSVF